MQYIIYDKYDTIMETNLDKNIYRKKEIVPRLISVYCFGFLLFSIPFFLFSCLSRPYTSFSPTRCIALFIVNEWHLEPSVSKHRTANY